MDLSKQLRENLKNEKEHFSGSETIFNSWYTIIGKLCKIALFKIWLQTPPLWQDWNFIKKEMEGDLQEINKYFDWIKKKLKN